MIGDASIDLTEETKFGRPQWDLEVNPIRRVVNEIHRFPWRIRQIEIQDEIRDNRFHRKYGDPLSDEMNMVVRRTSTGGWFFGTPSQCTQSWFWNLFEEILLEIGLYRHALKVCPRCGKKELKLNGYEICYSCRLEEHVEEVHKKLFHKAKLRDYIPWKDYSTKGIFVNGTYTWVPDGMPDDIKEYYHKFW